MKEGWKMMKLGDCCDIYQPKTIASNQLISNGKYLVYGANGIIGRYSNYNHQDSEILLCCRGATCGAINVSMPYSWVNGNAMVVKPKNEMILKTFLKYILSSLDYANIITGTAQPQITRKSLSPVYIAIPPLPEQHRIVTYLDTSFAQIDALAKQAEESLNDAKSLFQATLKKLMEKKEGWEEKKLKEVGITQTGTTPSKSEKSNYGDYIPFIRPSEIDYDSIGGIDYNSEIKLSERGLLKGRLFKKNSILMVCIGATIGKVGYSTQEVSCNQQINVLTPNEDFHFKFIYYSMLSPRFRNEVIKQGTSSQATLPIINKGKWELLTITYPSLEEQEQIATTLDTLSEKISQLQTNYTQTLANCQALKQALLREVFE